jgi:pimeloyl-ACP methyl ester carboxylesterase
MRKRFDDLGGATLEITESGSGDPLLFLHGEDGLEFCRSFIEGLSDHFSVVAPHHPGWGSSVRPRYVTTVRDISDVYDEFLENMQGRVLVVGVSLGAWIAAELMCRRRESVVGLVLISPIGIKVGNREQRDFEDIYVEGVSRLASQPSLPEAKGRGPSLSDAELLHLAMAEESVARFCWEPYMHDPKLRYRLRRIKVPTTVISGSEDRFVLNDTYFDQFASLIGSHAQSQVIDGVGHKIDEEAPEALVKRIAEFNAVLVGARETEDLRIEQAQ